MRRARGVKRTSDNKIAEVSTSKSKKRTKKAQAEKPEAADAQNLFEDSFKRSDESLKRSRLEKAACDVADDKITLEELDKALHDAVTDRNIRLGCAVSKIYRTWKDWILMLDVRGCEV